MKPTDNLHVVATMPLPSPDDVHAELPLGEIAASTVANAREAIRGILRGEDHRLLVVVGPCSIHDIGAAREYAERLASLRRAHAERLQVVMRVYFEKPRTTTGWKGLINDPHLDGTFDITTGLRRARLLLRDLGELGMPAATELLDPIVPQYTADLVSWAAIGARTTESQTHREMASGLSMPVGFKNGTDGGLGIAMNAMESARHAHRFLGINSQGAVSIVTTTGNSDGHAVLRGGASGPNYSAEAVARAGAQLAERGLCPRVMVDCSHDNAAKDHTRQIAIISTIAAQVAEGSPHLLGVMIESHIHAGKQTIPKDLSRLVYGQSITDACVDFETTASMLATLSEAVAKGRASKV